MAVYEYVYVYVHWYWCWYWYMYMVYGIWSMHVHVHVYASRLDWRRVVGPHLGVAGGLAIPVRALACRASKPTSPVDGLLSALCPRALPALAGPPTRLAGALTGLTSPFAAPKCWPTVQRLSK